MRQAILLLVLFFSAPVFGAFDHRTIDGDTINVPLGVVKNMPKRISVRLIGINTGETGSRAACEKEREMGEAAKLYVRDRLDTATKVKVSFVRWDKYGGRFAGRIAVDGKDLGEEMIRAGLAVAYTKGRRPNPWCPIIAERQSGTSDKRRALVSCAKVIAQCTPGGVVRIRIIPSVTAVTPPVAPKRKTQ